MLKKSKEKIKKNTLHLRWRASDMLRRSNRPFGCDALEVFMSLRLPPGARWDEAGGGGGVGGGGGLLGRRRAPQICP